MGDAKAVLRETVAPRVGALGPEIRAEASRAACERLASLDLFRSAGKVLAFASMPDEIDVTPLLRECLDAGKRLYLPLVRWKARRMIPVRVTDLDVDIVYSSTGMPGPRPGGELAEPSEMDLVIVPGRAFDRQGRRLGRGGGFYDRLLPQVGPAGSAAIAFSCQVVEAVPVDEHDVPIGLIVTEREVISTASTHR